MSKEFIERMHMGIRHLHRCDAAYLHTERVKETFRDDTFWEGDVEVFELTGHPKTKVGIAHQVNQAKKGK